MITFHVQAYILNFYLSEYKTNENNLLILSIRISAKNFGFENQIKSVPLYAVHCL
jgi:hypothetical protein